MVSISFTALFCSDKNVDLAYKMKKYCRECNINIINTFDIVDLTIKLLKFCPQLIFLDCSTLKIDGNILNSFLHSEEYKNCKIILVYDDILQLKDYKEFNFICIHKKNIATYICENATKFKLEHLLEYRNDNKEYAEDIYKNIGGDLLKLGFSPKHTGYSYLLEIMNHIIKEGGIVGCLYRDVYPATAIKFKTRLVNVERNVRNAIDKAWETGGEALWKKEFEYAHNLKKPSNREFICMLYNKYLSQISENKNKIISR